jgi:adenylylsulfate kinase
MRPSPAIATPVVWLTGLSGSGKTTIARQVCLALERAGCPVEYLDGDAIRSVFPNTGFSRAERDAHIRHVGFLASRLEHHDIAVVVSLVSPYLDSRAFARALCRNFVEVYVSTPLAVCEARDVKGLYAKARRGEIRNFTGLDDPYEPPDHPELEIDTSTMSLDEATDAVMTTIGSCSAGRPTSNVDAEPVPCR